MCTLHTFPRSAKTENLIQIISDWEGNPHGGSLVGIDEDGQIQFRAQCCKLTQLVDMLTSTNYARYIVHLRYSTSDAVGVVGCHMFDSPSGDWTYCHNGVLRSRAADEYRVDSILLGVELDKIETGEFESQQGFPVWDSHSFCNVIAHDNRRRQTYVHRSDGGQLTTDYAGSWSTIAATESHERYILPGWYELSGKSIWNYDDDFAVSYDGSNDVPIYPDTEWGMCDSCEEYCEDEKDLVKWGPALLCKTCAAITINP